MYKMLSILEFLRHIFEYAEATCSKCQKLQQTTCPEKQNDIQKFPQCGGCGAVFPWLQNLLCGSCQASIQNDTRLPTTGTIMTSMAVHQSQATSHCINQGGSMSVPVMQVPNHGLKNPAKICESAKFLKEMSKELKIMIGALLGLVSVLCQDYTAVPDLDGAVKDECMHVITYLKNNSAVVHASARFQTASKTWDPLVVTAEDVGIGLLHALLVSQSKISKAEAAANWLTLHVYVWAPKMKHDLEELDVELWMVKVTIPLRNGSPGQVCLSALTPDVVQVYPFYHISWQTCTQGNVSVTCSQELEMVFITRHWSESAHQSKPQPEKGYIGSGLEKLAFKGRVGNQDLALFLVNPHMYLPAGEAESEESMLQAMTCIAHCDFYLHEFYKYAFRKDVHLPKIHANSQGAFIGFILPEFIRSCPRDSPNHRYMKNQTFFAAPLIVGAEYYKYSGSKEFKLNQEVRFGAAVDAFSHFVLVDSNAKTTLCDLQGNTACTLACTAS
ncbi:hypothetical protein K439DRAFT_1610924 [Ramaria rubella]|nr:hypothetical protein K439DRAFT_1610924 [Ramaria rubella]